MARARAIAYVAAAFLLAATAAAPASGGGGGGTSHAATASALPPAQSQSRPRRDWCTSCSSHAKPRGWGFWEPCACNAGWEGKCCDVASASTPGPQERPASRPAVICSWWCPSGYTRRDVTIGPGCSTPSWIGKCHDKAAYRGDGCGYGGLKCVSGLTCAAATAEEVAAVSHNQVCK